MHDSQVAEPAGATTGDQGSAGQVAHLEAQVGRVVKGKPEAIRLAVVCLLASGHILIEDVPGVGKTTLAQALARSLGLEFQRIQFTSDLLPSDILGVSVYRDEDQRFEFVQGPIFANVVLADEINRASPKVQSALLEAMQERRVTIGTETFVLDDPFLVLATQNPIEQEGTYPLPEAQVDRFMLKLIVDYPDRGQEREILDRMSTTNPVQSIDPVLSPQEIVQARRVVDEIYIDDKIKDYIVDLVFATRQPRDYKLDLADLIQYGASPRATINLTLAARANAFLDARGYVVPQDIKDVAMDVLRHRVIVTYEAEAEDRTSQDIIQTILDHVPVP